MLLRVTLLVVLTACLMGQVNKESMPGIVKNLTDVIQWEIMWGNVHKSFRVPPDGSADIAISVAPHLISYCSHHLGVCAAYRVEKNRNWEQQRVTTCDGIGTDEEVLLKFVASISDYVPRPASSNLTILGSGGLSSAWIVYSPLHWKATISLEKRSRILELYKRLNPSDANALKSWLRTKYQNSDYISIVLSCYKISDPVVYFYGDRGARDPIIVSLFWDSEMKSWVEAGVLERSKGNERFDKLRATIQATACGTIGFN